jgi:hypothetical protein
MQFSNEQRIDFLNWAYSKGRVTIEGGDFEIIDMDGREFFKLGRISRLTNITFKHCVDAAIIKARTLGLYQI